MKGTLTIIPATASLKKDQDLIGKMDPYVIFKVGNQKYRTKTAKG